MIEPHHVAETASLVARLPRTGCIVFVADKADACLVRDLVIAWYGPDTEASTHILVAPTEADEALLMRGRPDDLPVFREPIMVQRRNMASMSLVDDMAEPRVPRREPTPAVDAELRTGCTACGHRGPGWCKGLFCPKRPVSSDGGKSPWGQAAPTPVEPPRPPAGPTPGAVRVALFLMSHGFSYGDVLAMDTPTKRAFVMELAPEMFDVARFLRDNGLLSA